MAFYVELSRIKLDIKLNETKDIDNIVNHENVLKVKMNHLNMNVPFY